MFRHETLRQAIILYSRKCENSKVRNYWGHLMIPWPMWYAYRKLMRKWWARVLGAKKAYRKPLPDWLESHTKNKTWDYYERGMRWSVKYTRSYRKDITVTMSGVETYD